MKIKDLPKQNRPRERFKKHGPEVLSDAELFAIILRTGTVNENVVDVSNRLIKEYGLDKLFDCSLKELEQIKGIGPSKAMQILAMDELGKRRSSSKTLPKKINCAEDVFNYFHERLKDKKEEHFYILMLNTQNNIIGEHLVSKGILDASIVHPREVFKPAIRNSSSKIVLVHNHPSGDPSPSTDDINFMNRIKKASDLIEIKFLDFLIIGGNSYWSEKETKD